MRAALAAALLLLSACGRPAPPPRGLVMKSNAGAYAVTVETLPAQIPLNAPFDLRITVAPSTPDLAVDVDARMPEHFHGMNRVPRITREADGSFKAEGLLFHMPGLWELAVDVTRGVWTERAQADIVLK